jgi:hypothetical protein
MPAATKEAKVVEGRLALEPSGPDATIHQRMLAILSELPPIGKTEKNEQQNFLFRGHDAVLNALNPLLAKHGVFVVPAVLDRVTEQRTTSRGSVMYEVNLRIQFTFWGLAGDSVVGSAWGEGTDMGDKATSKAHTMGFKTMLAEAFAVSTAEFSDPDAGTAEETTGRGRAAPVAEVVVEATEAEVADLVASLTVEGITGEQIEGTFEKARQGARGKLTQEYVVRNLKLSQERIERKAAARADSAPAPAAG